MKRSLRALLWLTASVPVLLLVLEIALQLGALLVRDQVRQVQEQWLSSNTRILALGDSNTFGFYLAASDAWPAQLERSWNAQHHDKPVEVLNLGYPGTNSFRVRDNLPRLLDKLSPDLVLIMVGFNDFWTPPEMVSAEPADGSGWFKAHSRVYRLWAIWSRSRIRQADLAFGASRDPAAPVDVSNPEQHLVHMGDDAFYLGTRQGEPARNRNALADNLAAMVKSVRLHGVDVVLMTYPSNWGFYPGANKWLKAAAAANNVPLVDITPLFIARCKDGPPSCPVLLFHDGHATAEGNALVAQAVLEQLPALLR